MNVTEFIIDTYSTGTPLVSTAKRYRPSAVIEEGYILIFAHGTGFHKEHWEPIIERLYAYGGAIVEAWTIDSQTHGAAATLNRDAIDEPGFTYSSYHYAEACANLYKTHLNGTRHPVVLIGHSAGAASIALVPSFCGKSITQPFSALILVEPAIWPGSMIGIADSPAYKLACVSIPRRRTNWESRDAVRKDLGRRAPWGIWDRRILDLYVEHGFEEDKEGVSLRCQLDKTRKKVPVHIVYGERNDLFTREKQDSLLRGRKFASVTRIPGAGHLVVQEAPDAVGDVLLRILEELGNQRYVEREYCSYQIFR
ncbi:Alpha/beta hydrolase family-domain-containing protein [Desarmillaria tabescens]|uniref:Alpha/beta hydrolase family-domain-containing protein n=1 Tax=Armillaria tabescens TaxID=1929756 RepID=A0AA39JFQ7_ARMTA|nr:Alpha/beta hydrolase family-domain-containing protein [Desarmillaria tabescens]KAK0441252.1 Alpha/beta hydrolase family-domain-containing protein [Desarmillaria tabescens]